jgi:hypothetical protein
MCYLKEKFAIIKTNALRMMLMGALNSLSASAEKIKRNFHKIHHKKSNLVIHLHFTPTHNSIRIISASKIRITRRCEYTKRELFGSANYKPPPPWKKFFGTIKVK